MRKRKGFKRLTAMLLGCMMLGTSLAGCGGQGGDSADNSNAPQDAQKSSSEAKKDEVVRLTVFDALNDKSGLIENTWVADFLKEELGIEVEILTGGGDNIVKLQTMMTADDLPDIVIFSRSQEAKNAVDAGMLVNLDDYKDKLPNAQKYCRAAMDYAAQYTIGSEGCYVMPNDVGPIVERKALDWQPYVRWDLYEDLGMPQVKDMWDLLDVLKQMQDIYPENEEGQKVYAISGWNDWDTITMNIAGEIGKADGYGVIGNDSLPFAEVNYVTNEMDTIMRPDSKYVEGLKWFFTANQMGILDPNSMTQTWSTIDEKTSAGRLLMNFWRWTTKIYNTAERADADDPKGFQTLIPEDSIVPLACDTILGLNNYWGISKKSEHIDKCIEYLDFMCNPDKLITLENGPQGEIWDFGEDGKPYLTETGLSFYNYNADVVCEAGGRPDDGGVLGYRGISWGTQSDTYNDALFYMGWDSYSPARTKIKEAWSEDVGYYDDIDYVMGARKYVKISPAYDMVGALSDEMQEIMVQIGDIVRTESWKAVYAEDEAEFNAIVNNMIEQAKLLGLDELMKYNEERLAAALELVSQYE